MASRVFARTLMLFATFWLPAGCQTPEDSGQPVTIVPETGVKVSALELRRLLEQFVDRSSITIQSACGDIAAEKPGPQVRRQTILWKLLAVPKWRSIASGEDPMDALIDSWAFAMQMEDLLMGKHGRELFGSYQPRAVEAAAAIEDDAAGIVRQVLTPEDARKAQKGLVEFVEAHPLSGDFSRTSVLPSSATDSSSIGWLLEIPLAPFNAFRGIDEHARAIRYAAEVADRIRITIRRLPEESLWQLELLLNDLETNASVRSLLASTEQLAKSSEVLAAAADRLPQRLREEVTTALKEVESIQAELRATLQEARGALADLNPTIERSDRLAATLEKTGASLAAAGTAWEGTFRAFDELAAGFRGPPGTPEPPPDPDSRGFDILDYARTADSFAKAGAELKALTADLDALTSSDKVKPLLAATHDRSAALIDHATWRAIQIIVALLVAALVYKLAASRIRAPGAGR